MATSGPPWLLKLLGERQMGSVTVPSPRSPPAVTKAQLPLSYFDPHLTCPPLPNPVANQEFYAGTKVWALCLKAGIILQGISAPQPHHESSEGQTLLACSFSFPLTCFPPLRSVYQGPSFKKSHAPKSLSQALPLGNPTQIGNVNR